MPPVLQKTIREIHQRLRALETREYAEVVGPGSVINAQYLTLALHAVLTAERRFVDGDGLVGTDAGANADYTLDIDLAAAWSGLEFAAGELRVDEDADFTWTGTHTFNANIALGAGVTIDGMDPSAFMTIYAAHDHSAGDPTQVDHADLVNVLANQHHAEVHAVNSTGPHAEAGLTIGHVLRASAAAVFSFAALQAGDIPGLGGVPALTLGLVNAAGAAATYVQTDASVAIFDAVVPGTIQCDDAANTGAAAFAARRDHQHAIVCDTPVDIANANAEGTEYTFARSDHVHNHPAALGANLHHTQIHDVVGGDHTLTGAQWSLVGATALNTIGLLIALDDVSAPAEAILKSNAAGGLTLVDLTITNNILLSAGAEVGITGQEWIEFNADIIEVHVTATATNPANFEWVVSSGASTATVRLLVDSDAAVVRTYSMGVDLLDVTGGVRVGGAGAPSPGAGDMSLLNDLLLLDGAVIGITGNERIQFNAAGTIQVLGTDLLMGTEDGGGKLNFDEGTTIATGIVWGSDANKVTLYRSADDVLKTDDAFHAASLALTGEIRISTLATFHIATSDAQDLELAADTTAGTAGKGVHIKYYDVGGTTWYNALDVDNIAAGFSNLLLMASGGNVGIGCTPVLNLQATGNNANTWSQPSVGVTDGTAAFLFLVADDAVHNLIAWDSNRSLRFGTGGATVANPDAAYTEQMVLTNAGALAVTGCVTDGTCEIFIEDALTIIKDIHAHGSGEYDEYGHEHFDMAWMFDKYPFLIYKSESGYFDKLGAKSDLLYRAAIQLDEYRLTADAEREAIREQIGILKNRLAVLEAA